jgi:multidrug resistance efflux pump
MNAGATIVPTLDPSAIRPRAKPKRGRRRVWWVFLLIIAVIPATLFAFGYRPRWSFSKEKTYTLIQIDRGNVLSSVVEAGSLENADNATVRCRVEALLGTVGGPQAQGMTGGGGGGGNRGMGGGGGNRGAGGRGGATSYSSGSSGTRTATTKGAGTAKGGSTGGTASMAGGAAAMSTGMARPVLSSFSYMVMPHIPLRPAAAASALASTINQSQRMMQQQQSMMGEDRPGSTRILKILEEGSHVSEGDIVCWLEDSALKDELQAQLIKWSQAKSWVEQAEKALEVAEISLLEYTEGVYPRDQQLVDQYIYVCRVQLAQSKTKLDWTTNMHSRLMQSEAQVKGATYEFERMEVALKDALSMKRKLEEFTMPKLVANLEAKIAAVRSDLLAQRVAFQLEDQRKARLETAISHCILRAPRDGMVVYVNQANRWGQVENPMREGVTVRENQSIFQIPNSGRMKVKAKINESKVSLIKEGTRTRVRVEALPNLEISGTVDKVTVIPSTAAGPFSDVKVYYADIDLDDGNFEGLKPGMTALVEFLVEDRNDVNRVPIRSLRWFNGIPFAAVPSEPGGYSWKPLELGVRDAYYAEVVSGIERGQQIIADPSELTPPVESRSKPATVAQAADVERRAG